MSEIIIYGIILVLATLMVILPKFFPVRTKTNKLSCCGVAFIILVLFTLGGGYHPPIFTVNRPFFFEIRDDRSGTILFMGKITNPTLN